MINNIMNELINRMNMITDKLVSTRISQDGTIRRTKFDGSTTITETNGNTITTEPDDNNTIGNRLDTVETGLQNLENEIDETDVLVTNLGTTVHNLGDNVETSRQNMNRIALATGSGGSMQETKNNG